MRILSDTSFRKTSDDMYQADATPEIISIPPEIIHDNILLKRLDITLTHIADRLNNMTVSNRLRCHDSMFALSSNVIKL